MYLLRQTDTKQTNNNMGGDGMENEKRNTGMHACMGMDGSFVISCFVLRDRGIGKKGDGWMDG